MAITQGFDDLKSNDYDYPAYEIAKKLYTLTTDIHHDIDPKIKYGGIFFGGGGIYTYQHYISYEFAHGVDFDDSDGQLEGSGKHRRHVKLSSLEDINGKDIAGLVRQINLKQ